MLIAPLPVQRHFFADSSGKDAMFTIQGNANTAKVFTQVVEETACRQIRELCDQSWTAGAKIRIMPDVHAGAGCTIGTTMTITHKAVPNLVGVDIGCGLVTRPLSSGQRKKQKYSMK